jgi:UDP-2,3-diacylglucosamine hydrolase
MNAPVTQRFAELHAPGHWHAVDFVSDLHLQVSDTATADLWRTYLQRQPSSRADALFILGDLFEVWLGDDVLLDPVCFASECAALLRAHSRDTPVFFMHGNRDFLLGEVAAQACGMRLLQDPCVLELAQGRFLLSHGDALCLDDTAYQRFRTQVRSPEWQTAFLSQPLAQREAVARSIRGQSEARKQAQSHDPHLWADVDTVAARAWLERAGAHRLVHGHTHRPAQHDLGNGCSRTVLSDWDAGAKPRRAEVLRLEGSEFRRIPL